MPEFAAQSARNEAVTIHTDNPAKAAALYVRTLPAPDDIEHVLVTDPSGNQTLHAVDTAAELMTGW